MYGVRLLGVGRLMLSMEKMARVDVGLDEAQPNLRAAIGELQHRHRAFRQAFQHRLWFVAQSVGWAGLHQAQRRCYVHVNPVRNAHVRRAAAWRRAADTVNGKGGAG